MSKYVMLKTNLTERLYLEEGLKDLKCEILKTKKIQTLLNRIFDVDIAVKTPFGIIGFVMEKDGTYHLTGDDMILKKNTRFIDQISQRYAYHKIIDEAKKAGFNLVKETTDDQNAVRLVLRKWN